MLNSPEHKHHVKIMNRVFWKNTRGFTDTLQKWMLLLTSTGSKPRTKSRRKKAIYRRPEYKASKDSVRKKISRGPRRDKPGVQALKKIRWYRNHVELIIPKTPLARLFKGITYARLFITNTAFTNVLGLKDDTILYQTMLNAIGAKTLKRLSQRREGEGNWA